MKDAGLQKVNDLHKLDQEDINFLIKEAKIEGIHKIKFKRAVNDIITGIHDSDDIKQTDDDMIAIWEWKDNDGTWKPYDKDTSDKIEALKVKEMCQFKCKENNQTYKVERISGDKLWQININTNMWRDGRRTQRKANESEVIQVLQKILENSDLHKLSAEQAREKLIEQFREPMDNPDMVIIWKWKDDDGAWKTYDKQTNDKIEALEINGKYQFCCKDNE